MVKFQEFRRNNKSRVKKTYFYTLDNKSLDLKFPDYLYAVPNEENLKEKSDLVKENEFNPCIYFGIIGGVLTNFSYIGALDHRKEVYLTDINDRAIDHLAFFLYNLPENGDMDHFISNVKEKKLDEKEISDLFGKNLPDFSLYNKKNRKHIALRLNSYLEKEGNEDMEKGMQIMYENLRENKILPFRSDINNGGFDFLKRFDDAFFYLSNVKLNKEVKEHIYTIDNFMIIHENS